MSAFSFHCFFVFAAGAFALGACIASFLNVCIWRIPRGESVVRPPSHCPKCGAPIRWWQNIPIASWCCLRGRCARCREPISARYAVVEALGGVLFLAVFLQWATGAMLRGPTVLGMCPLREFWAVPAGWAIVAWLMVMAFIDLEHAAFPSNLLYWGMAAGPLLAWAVPELQGEQERVQGLLWSLGGEAVGFASLGLVRVVGTKAVRRWKRDDTLEALGDGDPYFLAAVGGFFGPLAAVFTIMASSFAGALAGLALVARGRVRLGGCTAVPYGPFLALGAGVWMLWGPAIVRWYLSLGAGWAAR